MAVVFIFQGAVGAMLKLVKVAALAQKADATGHPSLRRQIARSRRRHLTISIFARSCSGSYRTLCCLIDIAQQSRLNVGVNADLKARCVALPIALVLIIRLRSLDWWRSPIYPLTKLLE